VTGNAEKSVYQPAESDGAGQPQQQQPGHSDWADPASPPDIKVRYNGIILTKEELWISHYLLAGYGRTAKGHLVSATQNRAGGSGDAAYQSHNHDIDNDYTDSVIYHGYPEARHVRGHHAHAHQRGFSSTLF
jgi:hypothetical protein